MNPESVSVSVCMITYNHENFVARAIQGVLMQQTGFPVELVIGEDQSADGTRRICEQFVHDSDRITLLEPRENLGMVPNFIRTLNACRGKYVALCEGDDFWTDPDKLRIQVEFLEEHPDYTICFHRVRILDHDRYRRKDTLTRVPDPVTDVYDLARNGNYIHTCSCVFRNGLDFKELPADIQPGDYALHLLNTRNGGKIMHLDRTMAVYRLHGGGTWSAADRFQLMRKELAFYASLRTRMDETAASLLMARFIRIFTSHFATLTSVEEQRSFLDFVTGLAGPADRTFLLALVHHRKYLESSRYLLHMIKNRFLHAGD